MINIKHGGKYTPEYDVWINMKQRCYNNKTQNYYRYGGRGIKVCDRWLHSFENFLEDMGKRPSNLYSLDRIDNNDNYYKENCKWSTVKEQANNRKTSRLITALGKTQNICDWAQELGMKRTTLMYRLDNNYTIESILTTKYLYKRSTTDE